MTVRQTQTIRRVPPFVRRRIDGISAVLLPFTNNGTPDWESFRRLLDRTWTAGLTPAVNMDTGYVNLLTRIERARVLSETREVGHGRRFVAGAFVNDVSGDPAAAYIHAVADIRAHGGTPILFQCDALAHANEDDVLRTYAHVAETGGPLLAFELGSMFAPFGRIYSANFMRRLFDIEAFVGAKHSSLDRLLEWERLELRDRYRPDFRVYTGNDLAIDMVFYGSDYLLGLSAFAVDAFAVRDRLWADDDARVFRVNDLLQYLGHFAFRSPVPAYKHSAAQFLKIGGHIATDRTHPLSLQRPESDVAVLTDIDGRLSAAMAGVT